MKIDDYSKNMMLSTNEIQIEKEYWQKQLGGEAFLSSFPNDIQNGGSLDDGFLTLNFKLPFEVSVRVTSLGNKSLYAIFMILLSGIKYLLYRYSGNEDIIVGMPAFKQKSKGTFINNILFLRSRINTTSSYKTFLTGIKETVLEADKHQNYPFEKIAEQLNIQQSNDVYQIPLVILMDNIHDKEIISEINAEIIIDFLVEEDTILFNIHYQTKFFTELAIKNTALHFTRLLETVTSNTGILLSEIDILTEEEKKIILHDFNNTSIECPSGLTIHRLFEEQVEKTPDDIAIVCNDKSLTYFELNKRANLLAQILRDKVVKVNNIVGIMLNRSVEMLIGIIGILKAGGAYLPIDPQYPRERIKYMLEDSNTNLLVTKGTLADNIEFKGEVIDVVNINNEDYDTFEIKKDGILDNLAYVIYTSGSTGKPKGVMIEHKSVINFIKGVQDKIDFSSGKSILGVTTISFDIFVLETLLPLTKGLKIVLVNEDQQSDPRLLIEVIEKNNINIVQTTPSRLKMLLEIDNKNILGTLDVLMIGGEALSGSLFGRLKKISGPRIYNMYGPTETTVWSSIKELTDASEITIGNPISNTQMYIFNRNNMLQPIGVTGELCIAGDGLARGYLNNSDLTDKKFVYNPLIADEKMYRTGDLAAWLPNGEIKFIGRIDFQVKVRGYRIELSEIENTLLRFDKITEVLVILKEDERIGSFICAYYVSEEKLPVPELVEYLSRHLPGYMIPAYFVHLDKIPLTPNGKVDRKSLSEPGAEIESGEEYVAPSNEIQELLTVIWQEVLAIQKVGINDNFFNIGGNSILLISLHSKIEELFPGRVKAVDIFTYTTIKKLADFIEKSKEFELFANNFDYVILPEEYFLEYGTHENKSDFEFFIEESTLDKVKQISLKDSVDIYDILVSLYTQLFCELSGSRNISIHTMINSVDEVIPIKVDLEQIDSFANLISSVKKELSLDSHPVYKYYLKDLFEINVIKKDSAVIPFFYKENLYLGKRVELLDSYDIVFSVREEGSKIRFLCKYDAGRLKSEGIMRLIDAYLKLFDFLIDEYAYYI